MDATISVQTVFWLAAGVAGIIGLVKIFKKPFDQIDDHERRLKNIEENLTSRKQTDELILTALNAMVNHMIDGNSLDKLKKVRDDFQDKLISGHK